MSLLKTQQGRAAFRVSVFLGLAVISPAHAQVSPDYTTIPVGSPLGAGVSRTSDAQSSDGSNSGKDQQSRSSGSQVIEPVSISGSNGRSADDKGLGSNASQLSNAELMTIKAPAKPGEFEKWLFDITGRKIKRFGSDLLVPSQRDYSVPSTTTIPPDYALNVGDSISISLTGSVEGSAEFEVDRDGKIYMPNVGSVSLIGVRYRDLEDRISAAVGRQYRGYEVSVSISKLRGVRVYVTGFANSPGAYTVTSLSTLVNAVLAAGGPSSGGSFRSVKLYRNGREVADFDLYRLIREGDKSTDPLLQNEDVLFIPPLDRQIAVVGSVNEEAVYEARPGESLEDVLRIAGGPTNLADPSRLILYRLSDRDTVGSRQLSRDESASTLAQAGDILQLLPEGSLIRPIDRQSVVVRIEGEVRSPGNYFVAPNTPLETVVQLAGGLTPRAYVFGTQFSRESVRAQQRKSFLEAVDQMETALAAAPLTGDRTIEASERQSQLSSVRAFIDRLRQAEPDGRLVLNLAPFTSNLPGDLLLENNDRIIIPPRVNTVGVFGAVYRPASFLGDPSQPRKVKDYIDLAGGPLRAADKGNIFLVRANGSVVTRARGALSASILPGDVVFVPVKTESSSVLAKIKDISTIVFQLGVSAAALAAIN